MRQLGLADQFVAEIHLFPDQIQNRSDGLDGEWRTILGIDGEQWLARLSFTGNPMPGDTFPASVQLLISSAAQHFSIGVEFSVWEAGMKGAGRVVSFAA